MIYILVGCEDGIFGINCSSICGYCYKGQLCDKKMGVCFKECDFGYEGFYCNKSEIIIDFDLSFILYRF